MSKLPFVTLWVDAWIADTQHLTRCERGTYMDLLLLMWRTPGCSVPNDDAWLGRHLRMTQEEVVTELRPIIAEYCQSDGNRITQKRLKYEHGLAQEKSRKSTVSANIRWNKEKGTCEGNASQQCERNAPIPIPIKEREDTAANAAAEEGNPKKEGSASSPRPPLPSSPPERANGYAFESGIIRLNERDLGRWEQAFPNLNVRGELVGLTEWAGKQGNGWFHAVSSALAKRDREQRTKRVSNGPAQVSASDFLARWEHNAKKQLAERDEWEAVKGQRH